MLQKVSSADGKQPLRGTRVLIVDDNSDLLELLADALRQFGCSVDATTNAQDALRRAEAAVASVALLDIEMPLLNGYDVAERLHQMPGWERVPLVALTGYTDRYHWIQAIDAGFTSYMTKPVAAMAVVRLLERLRRGTP